MNPEFDAAVQKAVRVQRLIAAAMLQAVLLYGVVLYFSLSQKSAPGTAGLPAFLSIALYVLSLVHIFLSQFLKQWCWNKVPVLSSAAPSAADLEALASAYLKGLILALAACEACALFGLILSLQKGTFTDFLSLGLIAAAGMAFHFPRKDVFEYWLSSKLP